MDRVYTTMIVLVLFHFVAQVYLNQIKLISCFQTCIKVNMMYLESLIISL